MKFNQEKAKSYTDLSKLANTGYGAIKPVRKSTTDLDGLDESKRIEGIAMLPPKNGGSVNSSGKSSNKTGFRMVDYTREEIQPLQPYSREGKHAAPVKLPVSSSSLSVTIQGLCGLFA